MSVKVSELMSDSVVTTQPHKSIDHVRGIMAKSKIGAVPIVNTEGEPVGIVSSSDMVSKLKGSSPISALMTKKLYTVPMYDDVSIAARVMRNHRIHRVVVTHEKKLVGILSAFDLLKLVEEHRYFAKNPPTKSKRKGTKRN
ncbi:MAG: CBS domain-containing protein [Gammaproteobacteria bacterium]